MLRTTLAQRVSLVWQGRRALLKGIVAVLAVLLVLAGSQGAMAASFADHSVLASGKWRKVKVTKSGIYQLSAQTLSSMGFANPQNVRIYGAGGHQLSYKVGSDSRDDLTLVPAIHRTDGSIIFYAEGPDGRTVTSGVFVPDFNCFSKESYYYVTENSGVSDNVAVATAPSVEPSVTLTQYDSHAYWAQRTTNIDMTGREWMGEHFSSSSKKASLSLTLPHADGATITAYTRFATYIRSQAKSYTIALNGTTIKEGTLDLPSSTWSWMPANTVGKLENVAKGNQVSVDIQVGLSRSDEYVYLSYVSLTSQADLELGSASQVDFRSLKQRSTSGTVRYVVANTSSSLRVWDVTNATSISQMTLQSANGGQSFVATGGSLCEYVAFDENGSFNEPTYCGTVDNHDLHAHGSVNYLVVTQPQFEPYAERFCTLHEQLQGFTGRVVMVDDIYDEFSAGRAEATAIRNYIKMLWERGKGQASELRYVLLLGAGSYDNFNRSSNLNIVPTYQSSVPYNSVNAYSTDDFYAWLEDGECTSDLSNTLDIAIGRLSVSVESEAIAVTEKAEAYALQPEQGAWRSKGLFLAHYGDANEHVSYAEQQATAFEEEQPDMETIRVYAEAYPRSTSSTGASYPLAVSKTQAHCQEGISLLHYSGHGGPSQLSGDYLTIQKLTTMTNGGKLFTFVAATCNVGAFDTRHNNLSEAGLFNPDGGVIAVFSANRETYGSQNYPVTRGFIKYLYQTDAEGNPTTFGEASRLGKTSYPRSVNSLKYHLFADPALPISCPKTQYVTVDTVNDVAIELQDEPIHALENTKLVGSVHNADGSVDETFNGTVKVTLFDKRLNKQTYGLDSGAPFAYSEWSSRLFAGDVPVTNGRYTAQFILSKEFDLSIGFGRVALYASSSDGRDAMGSTEQILVGGISDSVEADTVGPTIEVWVDYLRDANGNALQQTPVLHAIVSDPQGVNVTGQGVGHDLSLIIDGNRTEAVVLNEFFAYENGSSSTGTVNYQLNAISEGLHEFTLKAWDNLNNSSTVTFMVNINPSYGTVDFVSDMTLVGNNVNITLGTTAIGENLEAEVNLYTLMGTKVSSGTVKSLQHNGTTHISVPLSALPAPGLYVLRCSVSSELRHGTLERKILITAQ